MTFDKSSPENRTAKPGLTRVDEKEKRKKSLKICRRVLMLLLFYPPPSTQTLIIFDVYKSKYILLPQPKEIIFEENSFSFAEIHAR